MFLVLATLLDVWWYCIVVLICIFLMTNDIEHLSCLHLRMFRFFNIFHLCGFGDVPVQSSLLPPFKLGCYESSLHNLNAYFLQIYDLRVFFLGLWLLIFLVSFKEQNFLTIKKIL